MNRAHFHSIRTWLACTGLASLTVLAQAQQNHVPPSVPAPDVDAKIVEGIDANKAWADFIAPIQSPDHPPIHEIPPMPMGDCSDCPEGLVPPSTVTVHDPLNGQSWEVDGAGLRSLLEGGRIQGYVGADGIDTMPETFRGFGTMSAINNTDIFPWRANAKMVMRFVDQGGTTRWFNCSATMIDAAVALTAAHCVYARSPNGVNIFAWAQEIWVYPGWDGVGTQASAPTNSTIIQPYGWARGNFYSAGTQWINSGSFEDDVAVVRLQRPVGMVTGWFGMAWGFGCSTIQGRTYHNASFPGENCPTAGLHTGRQMYYWFGTFDSCPGNQLQIDTTSGCLTAVWGGMSGSSAYYISDGNRFAHAACSNSNRSTVGRYAKIWESAFNAWETFIGDTRGGSFDMAPLRMELSQTTIQAGTSPTGTRRHLGTNATNASRNATYTYRVYLSTTPNITTSDTLLSTQNYSWNYGPMSSVNVNMGSFTIPVTTAPGTYYIGVIYDSATDSNSSNNATQHWDTQRITVTLAPPAQVTGPNPPNNSFARPVTQNLSWSSAARATSYRVYFGTSPANLFLQGTTSGTSWTLATLPNNATRYWRIDSVNSAGTTTGTVWNFTTEEINNNCAGAIAIGPGTISGSTSNNSASGATGCTGNDTIDEWYRFTPPTSGQTTLDLCNSAFDTTVSVYTACGTSPIACNDIGGPCPGFQSYLTFLSTAGQTYRIRVSGWGGGAGNFQMTLTHQQAADCLPDLAPPFGFLDIFDVLEFLTRFEAQDPSVDFAPPFGVFDIFDVLEFLSLFEQGCP